MASGVAARAKLSFDAVDPAVRRSRRWRKVAVGFLVFLVAVLLLLWYIGVFGGNVREVVPGRIYRSAQLTGRNLDTVLDAHHIKTVLNLRGGSEKDAWYRSELASCQARGITHIDTAFSALRYPPPDQLQKLLTAFDTAATPLLFHCNGGSDRSGMAGTLYLNLYQHVPLDEAQARQLTFRYGHVRWGQAHRMSDFFALYRETSQGLGLRAWITTRYPTLYAALPASDKAKAPDMLPTQPTNGRPAPKGAEKGRQLSPGGG